MKCWQRTVRETIFLTSSLPSFSHCGAGRGWPAAALWLRLGELWGQMGTWRRSRTTVPVGRSVRRPGDFVLTYKCWAIAAAKRTKQRNTRTVGELCVADVLQNNVQSFCSSTDWHKEQSNLSDATLFFPQVFYCLYFHTLSEVTQAVVYNKIKNKQTCGQTEKAKLGYFFSKGVAIKAQWKDLAVANDNRRWMFCMKFTG